MRLLALCAALWAASCQGPDRWHVSGWKGESDVTGPQGGPWDGDNHGLELGVSGPIGFPKAVLPPRVTLDLPQKEAPKEAGEDGFPWELAITALLAIAGSEGTRVGVKKYRQSTGRC